MLVSFEVSGKRKNQSMRGHLSIVRRRAQKTCLGTEINAMYVVWRVAKFPKYGKQLIYFNLEIFFVAYSKGTQKTRRDGGHFNGFIVVGKTM